MKVTLTESQLKQVVAESVESILEEGWLSDRRAARDREESQMTKLARKLVGAGVEGLEQSRRRVGGEERLGFEFTAPMGEAARIAKRLKPWGVRVMAVRQGGYDSDGVSDSARLFAFVGRYDWDWMQA